MWSCVRTTPVPMLKEFVELKTLRLDRGWTYRRLVTAINEVSPSQISLSNLHGLLTDPKAIPTELTLDGIRRYLDAEKKKIDAEKKKARRRRAEKIPA